MASLVTVDLCVCFDRWNNLKMKVNQAKQRLGPRIQAEASSVTEVTSLQAVKVN